MPLPAAKFSNRLTAVVDTYSSAVVKTVAAGAFLYATGNPTTGRAPSVSKVFAGAV